MTSNQKTLDSIIKNTAGRILTVSFIKKNGQSRSITGRVGVKHHGKPSSHRMDSSRKAFILIYSMRDRGFRRIDLSQIVSIKADGLYMFNTVMLDREHPVQA